MRMIIAIFGDPFNIFFGPRHSKFQSVAIRDIDLNS